MTDDQMDTVTDDAAQDDQVDQTDQVDTDQADQDQKPFTETQEQYLGSWLGRIVAKQIDEKVLPAIQTNQPQNPTPSQEPGALDKFNEQLQEKIFSGDVMGALQMANNVQDQAKQTLSKNQTIETDRALTALSDKPFYKDTFSEAKKLAHEAVQAGYPSAAAVEYGYNKATADFLIRKLADGDGGGLDLSDGGRPLPRTKTPKLPPEFKRAYERDKDKLGFKSEAEYIAHLSPNIRAKYGI